MHCFCCPYEVEEGIALLKGRVCLNYYFQKGQRLIVKTAIEFPKGLHIQFYKIICLLGNNDAFKGLFCLGIFLQFKIALTDHIIGGILS